METEMETETETVRLRLTMETELGMVRMAKIPATERMAQEMERAPVTVAREEPTRIPAISLRFRERSWIRRIRRTRLTSPKTAHNKFRSLRMIAEASLF